MQEKCKEFDIRHILCFNYTMDIKSIVQRELKLPESKSFFIFGPRQTGKTTLINSIFPDAKEYNLLFSEDYTRFVAMPHLFREEVFALKKETHTIFIDEIQRVPALLNEIQYLLDKKVEKQFILSGSSARKLKRGQANLLGGRVWTYNLYPLTLKEMGNAFSLVSSLSYGTLPINVITKDEFEIHENLRAYVDVYLKEEIEAEAISRNIGGFIRFLSIAGQTNGEQINYSKIARDVSISSVTVREYFKILEDTLIGFFLLPFSYSERKKHKIAPKFYFFDTGVLRALQKRLNVPVAPQTFEFGNYFETWVINEAQRISSYERKDFSFSFLKTAANVEVDLIIETPSQTIAVEIKSRSNPTKLDFESGFKAIKRMVPNARCICVCTAESPRLVDSYEVLPYRDFFQLLRTL